MSKHLEVLEVTVTYALPDWFAPTESMTWFDDGQHLHRDSPHEKAIFEAFPDMKEICVDPQGKWITLSIPIEKIQNVTGAIGVRQMDLHEFLTKLEKQDATYRASGSQ